MSLSDLILFPYIPIEIFKEYKEKNKVKVNDFESIGREIQKLFKLSESGDKHAQLLLYDLYLSINHQSVYKDNITGKRIEQRLSQLFALSTGDEIKKSNPNINSLMSDENIKLFDNKILELVCSNYREKGDLFFYKASTNELYKLSIKSLVPTNKEINFGAFEFISTLKTIPGLEKLYAVQERKRTLTIIENDIKFKNIGLGSTKQLNELLNYIKFKGLYEEYKFKFKILLESVYKDDFLIYIKDNNHFKIYLVQNKDFIDFIISKLDSNFSNTRIEGNSLRISGIKDLINMAKVKINLSFKTCMPDFHEIEKRLLELDYDKNVSLKNSFIK